ncbi:MAG TPA: hypothetical protein VK835_00015 [Bacteroidia bacterium]|jgi:hypothetical protein|nr:hypothetical protein [Bacteroidia bacterium]
MKAKFIFIALIGFLITSISSCTKAGTGGNATVICKVYNVDNGSAPVNGATVYVKYGQSTAPSANNTGYDDHKTAVAGSNSVTFTGLKQGTYYFYAEGNAGTASAPQPVSGGNAFSLTHANRNGTSNASISVMY